MREIPMSSRIGAGAGTRPYIRFRLIGCGGYRRNSFQKDRRSLIESDHEVGYVCSIREEFACFKRCDSLFARERAGLLHHIRGEQRAREVSHREAATRKLLRIEL